MTIPSNVAPFTTNLTSTELVAMKELKEALRDAAAAKLAEAQAELSALNNEVHALSEMIANLPAGSAITFQALT